MSITYRADFGCWWPDYDVKPEACHKRVVSRVTDVDIAARMCKRRRTCVQAGGHAGLWPMRLARLFNAVLTFEPEPDLFECMERNIAAAGVKNIVTSKHALGDAESMVMLRPHCSAGSWRVDPMGTFPVLQLSIDSLNLQNVDALILDVEGYEPQVLAGAARTIERCSPVIMVEELPRSAATIRAVLDELGYKWVRQIHADHIYVRA